MVHSLLNHDVETVAYEIGWIFCNKIQQYVSLHTDSLNTQNFIIGIQQPKFSVLNVPPYIITHNNNNDATHDESIWQ